MHVSMTHLSKKRKKNPPRVFREELGDPTEYVLLYASPYSVWRAGTFRWIHVCAVAQMPMYVSYLSAPWSPFAMRSLQERTGRGCFDFAALPGMGLRSFPTHVYWMAALTRKSQWAPFWRHPGCPVLSREKRTPGTLIEAHKQKKKQSGVCSTT